MLTRDRTIRVRARKGDEVVEGTFVWDGLADLWAVTQADGTVGYCSVLWVIELWEEVTA